jgi:hypothetical protein
MGVDHTSVQVLEVVHCWFECSDASISCCPGAGVLTSALLSMNRDVQQRFTTAPTST